MRGDEKVRHCDSCHLNVYHFSEMTSDEILALIQKTEGNVCGRMFRRSDGTLLTTDCPVGLKLVRRTRAIWVMVSAVILTVITFGYYRKRSCGQFPGQYITGKVVSPRELR